MIKNYIESELCFFWCLKTRQGPYTVHTGDQPTELADVGCSGKCVGSNEERRFVIKLEEPIIKHQETAPVYSHVTPRHVTAYSHCTHFPPHLITFIHFS